jgi:hypothetical protein
MSTVHRIGVPGAALLVALAAGCSSNTVEWPTRPDAHDPPTYPPESVRFECRHWSPGRPASQRALFDLEYWAEGDEVWSAPAPWQIEEVRRRGGVVVRAFNVPVIRASIEVDSIPLLRAGRCVGVPDPDVAIAKVLVLYVSAPTEADVERLRSLGGTEVFVGTSTRFFYVGVTLLDDVLPIVRNDPRVDEVLLQGWACPLDKTE